MSKLFRKSGLFISFLAIFTLIYISVIQNYFLYFDDYFSMFTDSFMGHVRSGRFLLSLILYESWNCIWSSPTLETGIRIVRFAGIIGIASLAYIIFAAFRTFRFKKEHAFLISILVCTLPAIQVFISWIQVMAGIYAAVLSALSALILFKVLFQEGSRKRSYNVIAYISSIILFISALCIYQSTAMFYWSVGVIPLALLRDEDLMKEWRKPFIKYFTVGFFTMAFYFVLVKIVTYVLHMSPFSHRGGFITAKDILWKIRWFIFSPLNISLNLWNISTRYIVAGIVGIIILAGFISGLRKALLQETKERKSTLIWNHSQRLILIIGIIPLSLLPSLAAVESWATYRTIGSLEATICILLFLSILRVGGYIEASTGSHLNLKRMITRVILILLTVYAIFSAYNNVNQQFAGLHSLELQYVKNIINEYGISKLSETKKIYVRDHGKRYYFVKNSPFEFGQPESNDPEMWKYIVRFSLYDLGIRKMKDYTLLPADAPLPKDNNALIIDLTKLGLMLDERLKN